MKHAVHLNVLSPLRGVLIGAKAEILSEWIHEQTCATVLAKHEIDTDVFVSQYATDVFDYFMGVIAGEVVIGECPAMASLIDYLKHKAIRSDELFTLCTHFKRSVLNATYRLGINTKDVFNAISYLFDHNFAGVLQLYTDTIYQKEQEAIEAGRAKEYFLSNMSHEIRTPLNAILGFVALLKGEKLSAGYQKHLDIIAQSGESLLHIINDILDFSKLRSGVFAIDPRAFNIRDQMSNTLELYIPSANLKSIPIAYSIDSSVPECIVTDPFRLQQIVGNLLSNAIKFSDSKQSIEVNLAYQDETLAITVCDHGKGIAIEEHERIFDPFYQTSEGTRYGAGGSGLGLSISRSLANQMGGDIILHSAVGEGSLFTVRLPVQSAPSLLCMEKRLELVAKRFKGDILVAEDNEANGELIKMMLGRYGLRVELVQNGAEAYERFCDDRYDMVLMDEQMPVMNGTEALHAILEYEEGKKHTPIISLSANALSGAREAALAQGYDAFLTKPIDIAALEGVLETYLIASIPSGLTGELTESLQKMLGLRRDQIEELFGVFAQKVQTTLPHMREMISKKEYPSLARLAHSLKGACLNFRFTQMARLMEVIETSARHQEEEFAYEEAVEAFLNEYDTLYTSM